jgi:dihydrodipicolinate synthase/N-acetylneuraminate lyase
MPGLFGETAGAAPARGQAPAAAGADPRVKGLFLIPSTPFTSAGAVDYEDLVRQAKFMNWCGVDGVVWPQAGDAVDLLTKEEKMKGMEVLTKALQGMKMVVCLGVNGENTADLLEYAHHAESLAPAAIISRPPDSGKTLEDMREYYRALGQVVKRPIIIQSTGGRMYKGPSPSPDLIADLAREFPTFGYVKEESYPHAAERMVAELQRRPAVKVVFSAWGTYGWLYEMRLGCGGLISERVAYADLMVKIWDLHLRGEADQVRDLYGKFLLMANLNDNVPNGFRDPHLYILKKRGIIKTTVSRYYPDQGGSFRELALSPPQIAEIEYRYAALKPHLREGFRG